MDYACSSDTLKLASAASWLARVAWVALIAAGVPATARAQRRELEYDFRVDLPVTLVATSWVVGSELARGKLSAPHCLWCDRHADGSDALNPLDEGVRNALRWNSASSGNILSSVVAYGLAPVAALSTLALAQSHDDELSRFLVHTLLIGEAVALSGSVSQIVKFSVGRERPFVHALSPEDKTRTAQPSDNNTSFYSGHTSLTFALATSAGLIASLRGYRWAPWVWAMGLFWATATGYLRIAGDRHYLSDVMMGAAVGSTVGFIVPYVSFLRSARAALPAVGVSKLPGGALIALTWSPPP